MCELFFVLPNHKDINNTIDRDVAYTSFFLDAKGYVVNMWDLYIRFMESLVRDWYHDGSINALLVRAVCAVCKRWST